MPWYGFTKYGIIDIPEFESTVYTGIIFMYPSSGRKKILPAVGYETGVPDGFLLCDGSEVLITAHQDLYDLFVAVLGNGAYFGAAAAGNFKLPNLTDRFPIGLNPADTAVPTAVDIIGKAGGASAHSHTIAANHAHVTAAHSHNYVSHFHSYSQHTHVMANHTHPTNPPGSLGLNTQPSSADAILYPPPNNNFFVAKRVHNHVMLPGNTATGVGSTDTPRYNNGSSRVNTESATGPSVPATDTSTGTESATVTLQSVGAVDSIPPYYSTYFIIKD